MKVKYIPSTADHLDILKKIDYLFSWSVFQGRLSSYV